MNGAKTMKVKITVEISDQAPDPSAVLDYLQDCMRDNRYIKWYTIQPKRARHK